MGNCVPAQKSTPNSQGNCVRIESPIKEDKVNGGLSMIELNSNLQASSPMPCEGSVRELGMILSYYLHHCTFSKLFLLVELEALMAYCRCGNFVLFAIISLLEINWVVVFIFLLMLLLRYLQTCYWMHLFDWSMPVAYAGKSQEMFFDSQPCLESDIEDFISVNGGKIPKIFLSSMFSLLHFFQGFLIL